MRPYYALMLSNQARYLGMVGDLDGARAVLDQALVLQPTSAAISLLLGDIELASARVDAARLAFAEALRLDPDNREAAARLRQLEADGLPSRPPAPDVR